MARAIAELVDWIDDNGRIKTISYQLDAGGKILGKWEKNGTIKLMGAINSVGEGRSQIISESDWNYITLIK